ncbi:MAG: SMI1/KNR4 family protein [Pseudomonadota bacterium]
MTEAQLDAALSRYLAAADRLRPEIRKGLPPGAAPERIAAAEAAIGRALTPELKAFLARHDGSAETFVAPGWRLLSADLIIATWPAWVDLYQNACVPGGYLFDPDADLRAPDGPAKGDLWMRLDWIPFAEDGTGDQLCIDLDPAPGGAVGQIVEFRHDDDARTVLAPGLAVWFERLAAEMADGRIVWGRFDWGEALVYAEELDDPT